MPNLSTTYRKETVKACSSSVPVVLYKFCTTWTEKYNHCTLLPSLQLIQVIQIKDNCRLHCDAGYNSLFCRYSAVVVPSNSLIIQFLSFEGLPPLTGTLTINIIVDDVNDNYPEFTEDAYTTMVCEESPAGTVFAMITASDVDEGFNGELRYNVFNSIYYC